MHPRHLHRLFTAALMMDFGEEILTNKEGFRPRRLRMAWGRHAAPSTSLLGLSPIDALFESMSGFTDEGRPPSYQWRRQPMDDERHRRQLRPRPPSFTLAFSNISMGQAIDPAKLAGSNISALNETLLNATLNGSLVKSEEMLPAPNWRPDLSRPSLLEVLHPWLGGMGIIVLFMAILPEPAGGGRP